MGSSARFDRAAVGELLARQAGLITRGQATGLGVSEDALRHRLRPGGPWQVVLRGVYLSATGTPTQAQRELAALLYGGAASVITGPAAMSAHGMRTPEYSVIDVLVPAARQRRDCEFVRLHRSSRMPKVIHVCGDIRYAPPVRALADAARQLRAIGDVRDMVASAIQWRKVTVIDLAEELALGPAAGSARLRTVLEEVSDGVRSAAEAELRRLVRRSGLPAPLYNPSLYVGNQFIASPDAWWAEAGVAVEIDSREWHLRPADWERTMARHSRMSALGIIVLHYPPSRLRTDPRGVVAEIGSALESGRGRALAIRAVPA